MEYQYMGMFAREREQKSVKRFHINWKGEGGVFEFIGFSLSFIGMIYLIACLIIIMQ